MKSVEKKALMRPGKESSKGDGAPLVHHAKGYAISLDQPKPSPAIRGGPHFARRTPPVPSKIFCSYWRFAAERQAVYHRRVLGRGQPWTTDPIIATYRFTNAYRAADRVSQYLIRNVIYGGKYTICDTVFRILLFKLFNRIQTWELLEEAHGELTTECFDSRAFGLTLTKALDAGAKIYSAAYIMPSVPHASAGTRKHSTHLALLQQVLVDRLPEQLFDAGTMQDAYHLLLALPGIGPFLAYQFVTDINYSDLFKYSEMEFVVPGPGARDGIRKCFDSLGDFSEADTIRWVADRQNEEFSKLGLEFRSLWGRALQLIDCQNLFCEVDKYARVAHPEAAGYSGRTRIKQTFRPAPSLSQPWFPPKWLLNDRIARVAQPTMGPSLL